MAPVGADGRRRLYRPGLVAAAAAMVAVGHVSPRITQFVILIAMALVLLAGTEIALLLQMTDVAIHARGNWTPEMTIIATIYASGGLFVCASIVAIVGHAQTAGYVGAEVAIASVFLLVLCRRGAARHETAGGGGPKPSGGDDPLVVPR